MDRGKGSVKQKAYGYGQGEGWGSKTDRNVRTALMENTL